MKYVRNELKIGYGVGPVPDTSTLVQDPATWFKGQPSVGENAWLLAHALDGVIWGRIKDGELQLSSDVRYREMEKGDVERAPSPQLLAHTLLEARLFGDAAQVHIWRNDHGFSACRLNDLPDRGLAFDEEHRLWGTQAEGWDGGFTILSDGREGHVHAVPLDVDPTVFDRRAGLRYRPILLRTRHFLDYEGDGQATIVASRLVNLEIKKREARS